MSNIPASNPPESRTASASATPDPEDPEPSPRGSPIEVHTVWDDQVVHWKASMQLDELAIRDAVRAAASDQGYSRGEVGVRVTDDASIHEINRRHLDHDYPTDVISFPYADDSEVLEGELVVSVETADYNASEAGWPTSNELLLYVIHGTLHIAGMDDAEAEDRNAMREAEGRVLELLGLQPDPTREGAAHE